MEEEKKPKYTIEGLYDGVDENKSSSFSSSADIDEALLEAANNGDLNSIILLAKNCEKNNDFVEALKWFKVASKMGDYDSTYLVIDYLYRGRPGVSKNIKETIEYYLVAIEIAKKENNQSKLRVSYDNIANRYRSDEEIKDPKKAEEYYLEAIKYGSANSMLHLSTMYAFGEIDGEPDYKKAFSLVKMAAESGYAVAQVSLGYYIDNGIGTKPNLQDALFWYQKAAEQGSATAFNNLGDMYFAGRGVEQNFNVALDYVKRAIEKGSAIAYAILAKFYRQGRIYKQDINKAIETLITGSNKGSSNCSTGLGDIYYLEKGYIDIEKANFYHELGCKQAEEEKDIGHIRNSYRKYAQFLMKEKEDYQKALALFLRAAKLGDISSMFEVGCIYDLRLNDIPNAYKWYKIAASCGVDRAKTELRQFRFIEYAATIGIASAQLDLAMMYLHGDGAPLSKELSLRWMKEAANNGSPEAQYNLALMLEEQAIKNEQKREKEQETEQKTEQRTTLTLSDVTAKPKTQIEEVIDVEPFIEAKRLLKESYRGGLSESKEQLKQVELEIQIRENKKHSIDTPFDYFISWNHHDKAIKEKIKKKLKEIGVNHWESDEDGSGILNPSIAYAINKAIGMIVILSSNAMESKYMALEVKQYLERIARGEVSQNSLIIYAIEKEKFVLSKALDQLPDNHPFKALKEYNNIFSSKADPAIKRVRQEVINYLFIDSQKQLKESFENYNVLLSEDLLRVDDMALSTMLSFDEGYIERTLLDDEGNKYNLSDLLQVKASLIYGDGGTGKSLYVKNLIHSTLDDDHFIIYLSCSEISNLLENKRGLDLVNIIKSVHFEGRKYNRINEKEIYNCFDNKYRGDFYIIVDALDEASDKEKLLSLLNNFLKNIEFRRKDFIHLIFTSRKKSDISEIEKAIKINVTSLSLSPINEDDISKMFDYIYHKNEKRIERKELISKKIFMSRIDELRDDVRYNPLLMSNLIYVYLINRTFETQPYGILKRISDILFISLERRKNLSVSENVFNGLPITLESTLQVVCFERNASGDARSILNIITNYLIELRDRRQINEETKDFELEKRSEDIYNYLINRKIVSGNIIRDMYSSYFAATYIYNDVYGASMTERFLMIREQAHLEEYVTYQFSKSKGLWPYIALDFISKIDYEIASFSSMPLVESNKSYKAFDMTFNLLFDYDGLSIKACDKLQTLLDKQNGLNYAKEIKARLMKKKR